MTTTDLTTHTGGNDLTSQMEFARAVTAGNRGQSILPDAYRENPANVLIAVGLGQAMGLSPAESLYRISVIKGKPAAGAELIAANVRKAGHKLRVRGDEQSCTATIVRADDPDFEFTVTRDLEWAKRMGLASNDNYRKQPGTMLQWRAITAVARMACPEALYGVQYTVDEVGDIPSTPAPDGAPPAPVRASVADFAPKAPHAQDGPATTAARTEDVSDAPEAMTPAQSRKMGALMRENGLTDRAEALAYVGAQIGREVQSRSELSKAEAGVVIDALEALAATAPDDQDATSYPAADGGDDYAEPPADFWAGQEQGAQA